MQVYLNSTKLSNVQLNQYSDDERIEILNECLKICDGVIKDWSQYYHGTATAGFWNDLRTSIENFVSSRGPKGAQMLLGFHSNFYTQLRYEAWKEVSSSGTIPPDQWNQDHVQDVIERVLMPFLIDDQQVMNRKFEIVYGWLEKCFHQGKYWQQHFQRNDVIHIPRDPLGMGANHGNTFLWTLRHDILIVLHGEGPLAQEMLSKLKSEPEEVFQKIYDIAWTTLSQDGALSPDQWDMDEVRNLIDQYFSDYL